MSEEYNKIHSLAQARKLVVDKFAGDLVNLWPLNDDTEFIRDLMRQTPLTGSGLTMRSQGLIDYAAETGAGGYAADATPDVRDAFTTGSQGTDFANWVAFAIPGGRREKFTFDSRKGTGHTVYIVPADTTPSNASSEAIMTVTTTVAGATHTCTFPFLLDAEEGEYWALVDCSASGDEAITYDISAGGAYNNTVKKWSGSAWTAQSGNFGRILTVMYGNDPRTWASLSELTLAGVIEVDGSTGDGTFIAICDSTEAKVQIRVKSDLKVEATIKNTNGTTYTLTATEQLHRGTNFVLVSYKNNGYAKLFINGRKVVETSVSAHDVLNVAAALCVGAKMLADSSKTVSDELNNATVSDVFVGQRQLADADIWSLFLAFITAAPLMKVEGASDQIALT
ncbi:MAG: hypothetical protein HY678_02795 [Chloroflexi bacterium]|nr:hypothetical protein [Chloroflexota bacterium]